MNGRKTLLDLIGVQEDGRNNVLDANVFRGVSLSGGKIKMLGEVVWEGGENGGQE